MQFTSSASYRVVILQGLIALAAIAVVITEVVSVLNVLVPSVVGGCWIGVATFSAALFWRKRKHRPSFVLPKLSAIEICLLASIAAILSIIGYTAWLSPPNSADAMAYHLPRVIYWMQNRSVRFFPTSYLNQIMLQPVAEYLLLHLYLLSGGDHFSNLVQFAGFSGSVVGVTSIAQIYGLDRRGQLIAGLCCATLPNGILQASGAKNDCLLSLWIICSILFLLRWFLSRNALDLAFLTLSIGLALGTKATAYLFLPPLLAGAALSTGLVRQLRFKNYLFVFGACVVGILIINTPQYYRNFDLSGSVMGFDSAQGDGAFRWQNEHFDWKNTASNIMRNLSEQLGGRDEQWNNRVYATVIRLHQKLGIDPQSSDTTWRGSAYQPPRNANHEADANNRWHLLLIGLGFGLAILEAIRFKRTQWLFFALGISAAFVAFCFYLKWQPFFSRLEIPLFIVSAPLIAMVIRSLRPVVLQVVLCMLLISNVRLALFENWTRPLKGIHNLHNTSREQSYFNDMYQWNNRGSYIAAVNVVAKSSCRKIGIDNSVNQVEYPFLALLLARQPSMQFIHVGVRNASSKYAQPEAPQDVCAVLCLDCAGAPPRLHDYTDIGPPITIGKFLLFAKD